MSNPLWRRYVRKLCSMFHGGLMARTPGTPGANALRLARVRPLAYARLEELELRLAPAAGLTASNQQLLQAYGQLPISFEVNAGQTDAQVQYLAHGSGYGLFLTSTRAVLSLQQSTAAAPSTVGAGHSTPLAVPESAKGVALAMNLVGANPNASVAGQDQLPGTSNYFIGNDPSQWHTNVANYGKVAYQGVYPGVNLVYYGNQQQLEYDFVVAPGADPTPIRFAIQGADSISLDDQGNLVLSTASGDVLEHAPVVYQDLGGVRQAVAGQFVLLGQNEVGFQVGAYDTSMPLTIDPVLTYSTYLGGSGDGYSSSIAVDGAGNAYVTGLTSSTNFPTTTGAFQTTFGGGISPLPTDAFVTKLNASGSALIYSTYLGGRGYDAGYGIAVDGSGNAYVNGDTNSTNFPTTAGAFQTSLAGPSNDFVTKLNATGTALVYSTYIGGSGEDSGDSIAVDGSGNAFVTGSTTSTNFPTTAGAFQTSLAGPSNDFVTKLNATGKALVYSTYIGGSGEDYGNSIAVDGSGNAFVTGSTTSTDFPTTAGAFQTSLGGSLSNVFVTKLNATGTNLIYSTYLGGSGYGEGDSGSGIAVDDSGNAYVTGIASSADFPTTPGAFQINRGTEFNAFVTNLNATGTALIYSTYLGGNDGDTGAGIAVDGSGNAYVTGSTDSTDFPTTPGAFQTKYGGDDDAFVTKLNATGTALVYSTYLGGSGEDDGNAIALDGVGNAFVTGGAPISGTLSTNFPTTTGAFQTRNAGGTDSFVAKFTFDVLPTTHFQVTAPATAILGTPVTFTVTALDQNNHPTNGGYTGTIHFTSTDGAATFGKNNVTLTDGTGTFSATFNTLGAQTISVNDTTNLGIMGTSNLVAVSSVATQLAVSAPATATAGAPFLSTVLAEDGGGHIVSSYSGTVAITSSGGNPVLPPNITLTNGVGAFLITMTKSGSATITATDTVTSTITGTSGMVTIDPGTASYFTVSGPNTANTGTATPFTVTAFDSSGNVATGYTGKVHFTSSDAAATLPSNAALTNGTGMFNITFKTPGNQTVTATDTAAGNPSITGTTTIKVNGLIVTGFVQTPTGFVVTFNQPFIAGDIAEYGAASLVQPVTLVGAKNSNINGTLLFDPTSPTTLTFNATASTLLTLTQIDGTAEQVLPDDSYTVTLVSGSAGSNGFQDALSGLDGAGNGGNANYVTTFTTTYQAAGTPELGIPDFARGPSGATPQAISVPNDTGKGGIPITLYNANKVTDATFTLTARCKGPF